LHNPDNLRTLCHTCHKQVTVAKHISTKNLRKLDIYGQIRISTIK
jgi:hypothetical protein